MTKKFLALTGFAAFLFIGCSEGTTGAGASRFQNETNYNAPLTEAEIQEDLKQIKADFQAFDTDGLGSTPSLMGKKTAKVASLDGVKVAICQDLPAEPIIEEEGTEGSGSYMYMKMELTSLNGGKIEICDDTKSLKFKMTNTTKVEEDGATMTFDMLATYDMNMDGLTTADATATGEITKGDFHAGFELDLDMTMDMEAGTMDMKQDMIYYFLDDTYRCEISIEMSSNMNDFSSEGSADISEGCDLTHGGQTVGRLEMSGEEITIYDADGNAIE